ncbi:MAG: hypothetical protein WED34_22100 [Planctomycetales bacterium]
MNAEHDVERVPADCECPLCEERRTDFLVWIDLNAPEIVRCTMCGTEYDPNREDRSDEE